MTTATLPAPTAVPPLQRYRWSSAEFYRLIDAGFIREGSKTFLWDGEIVEPMAENPPHLKTAENLFLLLLERFPRAAWTINQGRPIQLHDGFDPQPDLVIMRGSRDTYSGRLPRPADLAILIEVASTSYAYDSGFYLEAYARAGIPVYWIVNLPARRVELYTEPEAERGIYRTRQDFLSGTSVPVEGAAPIAVDEVLRFATG